jgi:hypothetical protein
LAAAVGAATVRGDLPMPLAISSISAKSSGSTRLSLVSACAEARVDRISDRRQCQRSIEYGGWLSEFGRSPLLPTSQDSKSTFTSGMSMPLTVALRRQISSALTRGQKKKKKKKKKKKQTTQLSASSFF